MKKILTLVFAMLFAMTAMSASLAEAGMAEGADSDWYMNVLADRAVIAEYPYHAFVDVNGNGVPVLLVSTTREAFITAEDKAVVYLYDQGEAKPVMEAGGGGGDIFYANLEEHTLTHFYRLSGEGHYEVYRVAEGALEPVTKLDTYQPFHGPEGDNTEARYLQDDQAITEEAADELIGRYATDNAITYAPMDAQPAPADHGLHADIQPVTDSPEWVTQLPAAQDADQLFVVAAMAMDRTTASVSMHQKDADGHWKQILSTPGFVGKNGLCLDADHAEGCAQTPVGVYHFNKAFGIAADPGCAIPYIQVDEDIYWSGDPDYHYNEMVNINDYAGLVMDDSEHIVDYEYQYQYCLNISFNEEGTPGRGSAIFLHCFGPTKPYTGGCVALPENIMKLVMQNVREDCVVVIDTLENLNGTL